MPRRHYQDPTLSMGLLEVMFLEEKNLFPKLLSIFGALSLAQVDPVKLRQAIPTVLANQFMISFPMVVFFYPCLKWWGEPCRRELPTFHWFLLELAVFTLLEEVLFYYSHR